MLWSRTTEDDDCQVQDDEHHENEPRSQFCDDVDVEGIDGDGHQQTGEQNGPMRRLVSFVEFTEGGWEHTVLGHGVEEARR